MSFYQKLSRLLEKNIHKRHLIKYGFNYSPMYRRSTGRITNVSNNLLQVDVEIPLNWKNMNIMGTVFGGSMLSATDPIYMTQLMFILGENYVVWDKSASIRFRKPATSRIFTSFVFSQTEIEDIKKEVDINGFMNVEKHLELKLKNGKIVAELDKTIYVATKSFYKEKTKNRNKNK